MQRKQNEQELHAMMKSHGFYVKKSRDRGYLSCPKCHRPVRNCPYCHGDMLLRKAETMPDYMVAFDYVYVEGKAGLDSWNWKSSITPTQDKVCLEHESWLFLELGTGRAPKGRSAWLVPWVEWKTKQEWMEEAGYSSIIYESTPKSRNPVAGDVLEGYAVAWVNGGWTIPSGHPFWNERPELWIGQLPVMESSEATEEIVNQVYDTLMRNASEGDDFYTPFPTEMIGNPYVDGKKGLIYFEHNDHAYRMTITEVDKEIPDERGLQDGLQSFFDDVAP